MMKNSIDFIMFKIKENFVERLLKLYNLSYTRNFSNSLNLNYHSNFDSVEFNILFPNFSLERYFVG